MTTTSAPAHHVATGRGARPAAGRQSGSRSWRSYLPAAAGAGYLAVWVTGLSVWPSNLALDASSAQVAAAYQAHQAVAAVQYLLVEGLAGVLLGGVLLAAVRAAGEGRRLAGTRLLTAVLGAAAVVISVLQCVLGEVLAASASDAARAGSLFNLVDRLDGVKMLALAGTAVGLAALAARRGQAGRSAAMRMPRWLRVAAVLAALALAAAGVVYLLLLSSLAGAVYLAGPLLLLWITGTGIWLTVSRRRIAAAA